MKEDSKTDAQIVADVLAGKIDRFAILIERYERLMYSYLLSQVHTLADAEDIAQEAFLKAYKHLFSFDSERSFPAWLIRIARNVMIDRFRHVKNTTNGNSVSQDCLAFIKHPSAKIDPAVHVEMHEEFRRIFQSILMLPEGLKAPLLLRIVEEMPYEKIAEILEIPVQTVKNRIFKARRILRGKRDEAHDV